MMNTTLITALEAQAITAAKTQNWDQAISANQQILEQDPQNVNALMRLGVAQVQLGDVKTAKKTFEQVLELDKSNQLAKKHLLKLKNNQTIPLTSLPSDEQFIEEPGKTKTVELHRLASKDQLEQLAIGQVCELRPKNRFISVEVNKKYIGSMPEDLSSRLTKLMKAGNLYACYIRGISPTYCSVFLKETQRSKENEFINSFPVNKSQMSSLNDMFMTDDNIPLQLEDIPLQMVETDNDDGTAPDTTFPVEDTDNSNDEPEESHGHDDSSDD
jgi:tetratricopeptide (TPR) repeat protein